MNRAVVAWGLCASACINIHPYNGPVDSGMHGDALVDSGMLGDAPTAPPLGTIGDVSVALDGMGGAWATGPGYTLHFADASPHYPDHFYIGTEDVLASSTNCSDASLMGFQIYPAIRSDAVGQESDVDLHIVSPGPSVARLEIAWQAPLGGTCNTVAVSSSWTFFPDGRILRYDTSMPSGTPSAAACTCDTTTTFDPRIETLYTHHAAGFMISGSGTALAPSADGENTGADDLTCMRSENFNLYTSDGPSPHPQLFAGPSGAVGIVYRVGDQMGGIAGYGMSNIIVAPPTESCDTLRVTGAGYQAPPEVTINGASQGQPQYDGTGFTPVGWEGNVVQHHADVKVATWPRGFAIGLTFNAPYTQFVITKNQDPTPLGPDQARVQIVPGAATHGILWVAGVPAVTDTISVEASP